MRTCVSRLSPDVRVFTCPGAESLELAFRLAHPRIEKVELSESRSASFGVAVDWIKPLVMLDKATDVVFLGGRD